MTKLCPIVEIDGNKYAALTQQLAGIDRKYLGSAVTSLAEHRAEFIDAIDFMISGI